MALCTRSRFSRTKKSSEKREIERRQSTNRQCPDLTKAIGAKGKPSELRGVGCVSLLRKVSRSVDGGSFQMSSSVWGQARWSSGRHSTVYIRTS